MLYILDILLKAIQIIGIILGGAAALVLLALAIVLFVPIRYSASGKYDKVMNATIKATFALHIVSCTIKIVDGNVKPRICIFGINIYGLFGKKKKDSKSNRNKKNINSDSGADADALHDGNDNKTDSIRTENTVDNDKHEQKNKRGLLARLERIKEYIDILCDVRTVRAFNACKKRLGILIRAILPKKIKIVAEYGLSNPYNVARILAVYNALWAYIGQSIVLYPQYDSTEVKAYGKLKGRIYGITFLIFALRIIFDKNCKAFYYTIKELKNEKTS
ncbi:MAG: hypothetical protein KBT19_07600 [Lachnospiraceae bacterium]|nr:hypothetical protein [Candidatus Colinaster equi]